MDEDALYDRREEVAEEINEILPAPFEKQHSLLRPLRHRPPPSITMAGSVMPAFKQRRRGLGADVKEITGMR